MSWQIPGKTFLLGEYAALAGAGAIILTTSPCFEVTLSADVADAGIHPESPAGRWWSASAATQSLGWRDPWAGLGGLGASSAQFLGAWLASCEVRGVQPEQSDMLEAYYQSAWSGQGLRPSGYDVIAQAQHHCVYINRQKEQQQNYPWPFDDLSFLLLHSGHKLATHQHLQTAALPDTSTLSAIVEQGKQAFEDKNSAHLVQAVNEYQQTLSAMTLTAEHTQRHLQTLKALEPVLAAKGCGAMGADVLLLLTPAADMISVANQVTRDGWKLLATSDNLYNGSPLIQKKTP